MDRSISTTGHFLASMNRLAGEGPILALPVWLDTLQNLEIWAQNGHPTLGGELRVSKVGSADEAD